MIGFTTDDEQDVSIKTHTSKTVLDSFPEYNFTISNSLFKTKELLLRKIRTISVSICTVAAILSIVAFIAIGHWHPDGYIAFNCFVASILLCVVLYVATTHKILEIKKIYSDVYYIQSPEWCKEHNYNYAFIISPDKKWGLIKIINFKIVIPPIFDSLEWKKTNELISVVSSNQKEIRDINNNIVI